jgi:hypothetical protein
MKIKYSILLIVIGIFFVAMVGAGSHGHWSFRYDEPGDWLILVIIGLTLGLGIVSLVKRLFKRIQD